MDPKMKRIDPGNPTECDRLIERGHLVLVAITSEAHAARVAAQKAELEVALSEARRGDANMLRNWLESYRGISESPVTVTPVQPVAALSPQVTPEFTFTAPTPLLQATSSTSPEPSLSWDRLTLKARERLETRSSELNPASSHDLDDELDDSFPESLETAEVSDFVAVTNTTLDDTNLEDTHTITTAEHAEDGLGEDVLDEGELATDGLDEEETLDYQELPPELQALTETERDLNKPLVRSGTRGLMVSIVVHVALISTLMAITMHIPDPPASLGFEAGMSDTVVDSVEVMQPVEVSSPEEISPEMPSDAAESSVSLPSAVGISSTSVSAAGTTAASNMSGVQASANRAVSASSGRPNPANANASFFGAAASGNCFCYVIDGSESMRGGPWEAAKAELLRSLSTMKENHRFYIIFFNQKLNAITMPGEREPATSPLYATPENLKHARNWVESLRIDRGAPPNDALLHAIEIEPDAIYLLADGMTKIDVPEFLRTKNRTSDFISGVQVRVPIHAIAFYSPDSGQKLMKQVATENKGQFIYVPDPRKK